ncbi:MAG: hypothetical protein LBU44_07810 [Mediterranea sp.]|jgi:Txe/YoeB family toxin of Txe-Axe toxin-antitoxin module|nr:hypothetical protein [Mediterranea sp.]
MEIEKIYWRANALNSLKYILTIYHYRKGRAMAEKITKTIIDDIEEIRIRPYNGYIEPSMQGGLPQKIYSRFSRKVKILYYTEDDTLYIVDFHTS